MALRDFVDSTGRTWEAYDVIPREDERRRYDRRSEEIPAPELDDDRREGDRRLTVGAAAHIPSKAGWLCFENGNERRRLMPIPENWLRSDDAQLEQYLNAAKPVRLTTPLGTPVPK